MTTKAGTDRRPRPKHQRKELEAIHKLCEARGWRVDRAKGGYFKVKCGCEERHMRTVHLTPSDPSYGKNLLAWLARCSCWEVR